MVGRAVNQETKHFATLWLRSAFSETCSMFHFPRDSFGPLFQDILHWTSIHNQWNWTLDRTSLRFRNGRFIFRSWKSDIVEAEKVGKIYIHLIHCQQLKKKRNSPPSQPLGGRPCVGPPLELLHQTWADFYMFRFGSESIPPPRVPQVLFLLTVVIYIHRSLCLSPTSIYPLDNQRSHVLFSCL